MTEKEVKKAIYSKVKDLIDGTSMTALYLTIGLVVAIVVIGLLIFKFKRDKFETFKKCAIGVVVGYAVALTVVFAYLVSEKNMSNPSVDMDMYAVLFYPILATILVIVAGAIAMLVASVFSKKAMKVTGFVTLALTAGGFVAIMVEMSKYYKAVADWYPDTNLTGLIVSAVVFIVLTAVVYLLGDKRSFNDTKSLVYGAVAIALAYALSYVKFFRMPQGGSVTFASMLPLLIYSCMFGTRRGTLVCLIYGTLQAMQDPWIIHPMQFLLDYTLAYGILGVSGLFMEKGLFKNKKIFAFLTGGVLAVFLRYACHVCSGVFAFADLTEYGSYTGALVYSLTYNTTVFVDMVIALAAGSTLFLSKSFSAQMQRSADDQKAEPLPYDEHHDHGDEEGITPFIVPIENKEDKSEE
ncbi:MAG: energy-coupled thiamine transporter ThiT [Clostridia bacterium]|nr:energy-coupled thiamine transporter ThiT [Clostridia bacterium]